MNIANQAPALTRGILLSRLAGLRVASLAVADEIPGVSPGLRLWLLDRIDELQGRTIDEDEFGLDNSPKPPLDSPSLQ